MTSQGRIQAHVEDDLAARPRISPDDVRALLWLIAFVVILVAICAVDPTGQAAPR